MESSSCIGFMAIVAVSSSVAILVMQAHKRLMSDFMKKLQLELGDAKSRSKKKVRFAADVVEPSSNNKEYRKRHLRIAGKPNSLMENFSVSMEITN